MRAIYIMKGGDTMLPLFTHVFPSVQKRVKAPRIRLPLDDVEVALQFSIGLAAQNESLVAGRPVVWAHELQSALVYLHHRRMQLYFVAAPLLPPGVDPFASPSFLALPEVTLALHLLEQIQRFVVARLSSASMQACWAALAPTLLLCVPFGSQVRPLDTAELIYPNSAALQTSGTTVGGGVEKTPAWRLTQDPSGANRRSRITLDVCEEISVALYDKSDVPDVASVQASLSCTTDIPCSTEVSLKLRLRGYDEVVDWLGAVEDVCAGSVVSGITTTLLDDGTSVAVTDKVVEEQDRVVHASFLPSFNRPDLLLRFAARPPQVFPFRAFYQMKHVSSTEVKVLIQLKLSEHVTNSFTRCSVTMPFFNRGRIQSFQVSPTQGEVVAQPDGITLVWNLGPKIVGRALECALPMTVIFTQAAGLVAGHDPFCIGLTCYCDLSFIIQDFSLCGISIDKSAISAYPNTQLSISVNHTLQTKQYRVWNSMSESVRRGAFLHYN